MKTPDHLAGSPDPETLAHAVRVLAHPDDVLAHPGLTAHQKREVLAAWASDAHAVPDRPGLRLLDSGSIVGVDEVLRALRALDPPDVERRAKAQKALFGRRRRPSSLQTFIVSLRRRDDDDDDPPPSPAAALPLALEMARRRRWETAGQAEPVAA